MEKLTKDNVLLIEKFDIITTNAVKDNDDKIVMIKGLRLVRVVKPIENGFETIAQYDFNTDSIDLKELHNYTNYFLCSVDIDNYNQNNVIWNCCQLKSGADDNSIFSVINGRQCTKEECKLLDEVFPEFFSEAERIHKKKVNYKEGTKQQ